MTRDDHRAQCIEAMKAAIRASIPDTWEPMIEEAAIGVLTNLHSIARLVPSEATEEMIEAADPEGDCWFMERAVNRAIAAGDLTNQPEEKP